MKRMNITTEELAKLCGVSQGTVDRALHGRREISEATRARILEAAGRYGYRAAPLAPDEIRTIGVIVFNLKNEYFNRLITELEAELRRRGCFMSVMFTEYDAKAELEAVKRFDSMGAQGIIICPTNTSDEFGKYLSYLALPCVAVGNPLRYVTQVGIDDRRAMYEQTLTVLDGNYEKLVYYSPALEYQNFKNAQSLRFDGFMQAVTEAGFERFEICRSLEAVKETYAEKCAVICSTDRYALDAYLKNRDADIIGFDGIISDTKPKLPIASVEYSYKAIAAAAADAVLKVTHEERIIIPHRTVEVISRKT